ncbi:MAG TPA: hypothetical protein PKZ84_21335 [Anaerolineae bacterium]|nr:hypothetical protein [Anaerolineae bacterium]HQI87168.1 hypothetical protein [Anaerolineae bacterium]
MSTETITLQVPTRLYADLSALAEEEQTDVVGVISRLLKLAERDTVKSHQSDPVFALIGAYHSNQPLIDNIPASEDPDLYLLQATYGESSEEKHAWEIAPMRYRKAPDNRPVRIGVVAEDQP